MYPTFLRHAYGGKLDLDVAGITAFRFSDVTLFSPDDQEEFLREYRYVSSEVFTNDGSRWEEHRRHMFHGVDELVSLFAEGRMIGAATFCLWPLSAEPTAENKGHVLYLNAITLHPAFHGKGVFRKVVSKFLRLFSQAVKLLSPPSDIFYVATRTQNGFVATGLQRLFGNVAPLTAPIDEEVLAVSRCVSLHISDAFDVDRFIFPAAYGGQKLMAIETDATSDIGVKLKSVLDVAVGDCMLLVSLVGGSRQ
eukprot:Rmarinus@m.10806